MSLVRSGIIVGLFTLLSRISGYIRDISIASYLGTGFVADAFTIAFKLPNFFRTIFAEGAFSASFVPIFAKKSASYENKNKLFFADNVLTILLFSLILLVSIFEIFMPFVMHVLAPGFTQEYDKFQLVISLGRITFPYLLFISITTLFISVLNCFSKFALGSALPVVLNLSMIIAIIFWADKLQTPGHALAIGVFIAGIVQLITIVIVTYRIGIIIRIRKPVFDEDTKLMFKNMLPAIIGSGVVQINLWIGTILATSISGAVSIIYYAERLNQFPLAIIGTAIGTVLLPTLSRQLRNNEHDKAIITQNNALEVSLFFTLPCSFALIIIGDMIVAALFQREAFTANDTIAVASTLSYLAMGLPAYVMTKIFTPRFFADFDTKTPVKISFISMVCNIVSSLILVKYMSYVGIVFAASLSGWVNLILLIYFLHRRKAFIFHKGIFNKLFKILFSCMIMSIILYFLKNLLTENDSKYIKLIIIILLGSLSYLLMTYKMKIFLFKTIKKELFNK